MKIYHATKASTQHPDRNEDALMILEGDVPVFAVIDGLGGHQHVNEQGELLTGREASQLTSKLLQEHLTDLPTTASEVEDRLIEAIAETNHKVYEEMNEKFAESGRIGAVLTVAAICEQGKKVVCVQMGDPRTYLQNNGTLTTLCPDEDNIELLVRQGMLAPEDGLKIRKVMDTYDGLNEPEPEGSITLRGTTYDLKTAWRWFVGGNHVLEILPDNVVINALGIFPMEVAVVTAEADLSPGDQLLVCSDGLYKNLSEAELLTHLKSAENPAEALCEAAFIRSQDSENDRMVADDLTAIVVQL